MSRNFEQFPDDDNGDALWDMKQEGDHLDKPREIDFSVVFADEESALKFGELLLLNRHKVSLLDYPDNEEYPFEIIVHVYMEPIHEDIVTFEEFLTSCASPFEGVIDGWGCFEQVD